MNFHVNRLSRIVMCLGSAITLVSSMLSAQVVVDGTTNTLDHITNSITGNVTVGTNGSFTTLILTNGALLTNSGNAYLGLNFGANSNVVWLTGSNTRWDTRSSPPGTLYLGSAGAFNRLVVSNGAHMGDYAGYIGGGPGVNLDASNNTMIVTGTNSVWTNTAEVIVGNWAGGNRLEITNGGTVFSAQGILGNVSPNNTVLISGEGSRWTNSANIAVGSQGDANSLIVESGGRLDSVGGSVGGSKRGNIVVLNGTNSLWNNRGALSVSGGSGTQPNQVIVSNGAALLSSNAVVGAVVATASNNLAIVTGAGSLWSNQWAMVVGAAAANNRLHVLDGGTLVSYLGVVGTNAAAPGSSALVSGTGSVWTNVFLYAGYGSSNNSVTVSNGGLAIDLYTVIGFASNSANNLLVVTGTNSLLNSLNELDVGFEGKANRLLIRNGGVVSNTFATIGLYPGANGNEATVSDSGSIFNTVGPLLIGGSSSGNRLVVTNGGVACAQNLQIGYGDSAPSSNNELVVTGTNSVLVVSNQLYLGAFNTTGDRMTIRDGGTLSVGSYIDFGRFGPACRVTVDGGTVLVTNAALTGILDMYQGTNVFHAGLMELDRLWMDLAGPQTEFEFNGGTLSARFFVMNSGKLFRVGNGASPATLNLAGSSTTTNFFLGGLTISANAALTGNGTIRGPVTVSVGGKIAPGTSVGKIVLINSPSLQGTILMELSKNGSALTNDQIQVTGSLTYGGSLTVSNLGPTALAAGDNFKLFGATLFAGSFGTLALPPLGNGLVWTNRLLQNGSIEVVSVPLPVFATAMRSGTNMILSGTDGTAGQNYAVLTATNAATPASNWVSLRTNQFGVGGVFSFTNAIAPDELQRYFRIRTP